MIFTISQGTAFIKIEADVVCATMQQNVKHKEF